MDILAWIKCYLTERTSSIIIDNHYAFTFKMYYRVHQDSVYGPLLFSVYILLLKNIRYTNKYYLIKFSLCKNHIIDDDI